MSDEKHVVEEVGEYFATQAFNTFDLSVESMSNNDIVVFYSGMNILANDLDKTESAAVTIQKVLRGNLGRKEAAKELRRAQAAEELRRAQAAEEEEEAAKRRQEEATADDQAGGGGKFNDIMEKANILQIGTSLDSLPDMKEVADEFNNAVDTLHHDKTKKINTGKEGKAGRILLNKFLLKLAEWFPEVKVCFIRNYTVESIPYKVTWGTAFAKTVGNVNYVMDIGGAGSVKILDATTGDDDGQKNLLIKVDDDWQGNFETYLGEKKWTEIVNHLFKKVKIAELTGNIAIGMTGDWRKLTAGEKKDLETAFEKYNKPPQNEDKASETGVNPQNNDASAKTPSVPAFTIKKCQILEAENEAEYEHKSAKNAVKQLLEGVKSNAKIATFGSGSSSTQFGLSQLDNNDISPTYKSYDKGTGGYDKVAKAMKMDLDTVVNVLTSISKRVGYLTVGNNSIGNQKLSEIKKHLAAEVLASKSLYGISDVDNNTAKTLVEERLKKINLSKVRTEAENGQQGGKRKGTKRRGSKKRNGTKRKGSKKRKGTKRKGSKKRKGTKRKGSKKRKGTKRRGNKKRKATKHGKRR